MTWKRELARNAVEGEPLKAREEGKIRGVLMVRDTALNLHDTVREFEMLLGHF